MAVYKKVKNNHSSSGFTILELAVVLTVVALIAGSALAVGASRMEASKISATNERVDFLMEAIAVYEKQFCHLPCPADPSVANSDANFGIGAGTGTGTCTASNLATHAGTNVKAGAVPVRDLRISPALIMDGWGRKLTYVVDQNLTLATSYGGATLGEIQVLPTSGGTAVTTEAAVLVLSHGTNGHGAWRGKGGSKITKSGVIDGSELENANGDHVFVQKFFTNTFDDIVQYKVKWQLPDSNNCP